MKFRIMGLCLIPVVSLGIALFGLATSETKTVPVDELKMVQPEYKADMPEFQPAERTFYDDFSYDDDSSPEQRN